jgi:hypothetical protein
LLFREVSVADRQFCKRVESGQCPTDEAIAAEYVKWLPILEAAKLLGVSENRLRTWAAAGHTRREELSIGMIYEARTEYEERRRLERGREFHERRRAKIAELEVEIEKGLEAQRAAYPKLLQSAHLMHSEVKRAVEELRGAAPKKAAKDRKRVLKRCSEYIESCERAHVDLPAREDGSRG